MSKLSDISDRILLGSTAGKIYKAIAEDVVNAIDSDTNRELNLMLKIYIRQSEIHLKDAIRATEEFKEYMKNKEWRNNGTKRISGQS